jgi:hypothetical protein
MEDRPPDAPVPPQPYAAPTYSAPPSPPSPPGPPTGVAGLPPIPWEDPAQAFPGNLFATIGLLYSKARQAYERMPLTNDVLKPYLFALVVGWIGIAGSVLWQTVFTNVMASILSMAGANAGNDSSRFFMPMLMGPLALVWAPFAVAAGVLIGGLIVHLFLLLLGAAKGGFVVTLRVPCYAQAASLLQLVPFCGGLAGTIVSLMFAIVGLSVVHRVSTGRTAAAVLLPGVLCCALVGVWVALLGGAAFLSHYHPNLHP